MVGWSHRELRTPIGRTSTVDSGYLGSLQMQFVLGERSPAMIWCVGPSILLKLHLGQYVQYDKYTLSRIYTTECGHFVPVVVRRHALFRFPNISVVLLQILKKDFIINYLDVCCGMPNRCLLYDHYEHG